MAMNAPAWILSQAFTKETADEFGAVKGAPCTVGDVSYDADGNTVVELVWTNSAGTSRTTPVTIKKGLGIKSVTVDADEHLILTMTDDTTIDAGEIPKPDLTDYAKKSEIPEGSVVDEDLSETSKNPVQNKIVTAELKKKVDAEDGKGLSTNDYDDDAVAEVAKIKDKADSAIVTGHTNLDTGSDLNTLVDYGTYRTTTKRIDRIANVPVQVAGMLEVRLTGGIIYHTYKTIDDEMYIRSSEDTGATWADWRKISTAEDLADYVAIQHKAEDKGKALIVGEDGKVVPTEISTDTSKADRTEIIGENILPFPYTDGSSATTNGITFKVDNDGIVTINGTPTGDAYFWLTPHATLNDYTLIEDGKEYVLSGNENVYPNEWGVCLFARIIDEDGTTAHYEFSYSGKSAIFSKEKYPNAKYYAILMRVSNKQVTSELTNVIVKPMLEYGNTAHDFQPYRLNRNAIEKDAVTAKVNNFVKPTSNEEILALSNGIYSINVDDTTLFPNRWGTLIVLKSGYVYGSMIFIGTDAKYWFRNISSGAWRETAWQELATMDKVAEEDGTVSFNISLAVERNELSKVGKVVTFNAFFGSISGLSTKNTTFATIPEGFRPKMEKRLVGCIGETFQEFSIGTDGTIKCITSSIPGGATICAFNGSWLTD